MERTLVVVKPDAVVRGLIGEIIKRFESVGLKVVAAKFTQADKKLAEKLYPTHREEFIKGMGEKSLKDYEKFGVDPIKQHGTADPSKIGLEVREWLVNYLTSGPVLAVVLEGPHAVEVVRKLAGSTKALEAEPGTIRGDFTYDSSYLANTGKRALKNLVHASGSLEEAQYEIPLWFSKDEIVSYKRTDEEAMS